MESASHRLQVPQDAATAVREHLRNHRMRRSLFKPEEINTIIASLRATDWISENVLAKGFEGTQGFSLQFTRAGISKVRQRLPTLNPFIDLIETSRGLDALLLPLSRWLKKPDLPQPNAFYLNVLEVPITDCVTPHVDGTLSLKHDFPWSPPVYNTVLYLRVSPNSGCFALRLPHKEPIYFQEQAGDILYFRGDQVHSIDKLCEDYIDPNDQSTRLSLVCEHYYFSEEQLAKIPLMKLESKDAFKRVLEKKRNPPGHLTGVLNESQ